MAKQILEWMTKELVEAWTGCDNGEGSPYGAVDDAVCNIVAKLLTLVDLDADDFELSCLRGYVGSTTPDEYNVVYELWDHIDSGDGEGVLPTCLQLSDWIRCMHACKPEGDVWSTGLEDLRQAFELMAEEADKDVEQRGLAGTALEADLEKLVASEILRQRPVKKDDEGKDTEDDDEGTEDDLNLIAAATKARKRKRDGASLHTAGPVV